MRKNSKKIYFIRHGQTDHNGVRIFQSDIAKLNDHGVSQAKSVARKIPNDIEAIVSSPLLRAQETAKIIADKSNSTVEILSSLTEFKNPPIIRGKSYDDVDVSKIYDDWCSELLENSSYNSSDTENYYDLIERAREVLDFLAKRKEESLVAVTHSELIRAILGVVLVGDKLTPELFDHFQAHIKVRNCVAVKLNIVGNRNKSNYQLIIE